MIPRFHDSKIPNSRFHVLQLTQIDCKPIEVHVRHEDESDIYIYLFRFYMQCTGAQKASKIKIIALFRPLILALACSKHIRGSAFYHGFNDQLWLIAPR